ATKELTRTTAAKRGAGTPACRVDTHVDALAFSAARDVPDRGHRHSCRRIFSGPYGRTHDNELDTASDSVSGHRMTIDEQLAYLRKGMAEIIREDDLRER